MRFLYIHTTKARHWFSLQTVVLEMVVCNEKGEVLSHYFRSGKKRIDNEKLQVALSFLEHSKVVLLGEWHDCLDTVEDMDWFPYPPFLSKTVNQFNKSAKAVTIECAAKWKEEHEKTVSNFMRVVRGITFSELISLIKVRSAEWTRHVVEAIMQSGKVSYDEGGEKITIELGFETHDFWLGFGVKQGQKQMEFCDQACIGIIDQLMTIAR